MVSLGVFHRFKWKMPYFFHFWNKPFGICLARWEKIDFQGPFSFKKTAFLEQAPTKTHVWCIFSAPASLCGFFKRDLWDTPGVAAQNSGGGARLLCFHMENHLLPGLEADRKRLMRPEDIFSTGQNQLQNIQQRDGGCPMTDCAENGLSFFFLRPGPHA